jgi:hypothetical protein
MKGRASFSSPGSPGEKAVKPAPSLLWQQLAMTTPGVPAVLFGDLLFPRTAKGFFWILIGHF